MAKSRPGPMQPRQVLTMSGLIDYQRQVFHCPQCRASHAPNDREQGVEAGEKLTRRVRRAATYAATIDSFTAAEAAMWENFSLKVSAAQIANIANEEGRRVGRENEQREEAYREGQCPAEFSPQTVVLLSDATSILTRSGEDHKMVHLVRGFDLKAARSAGGEDGQDCVLDGRPVVTESRYAATAAENASAGGEKSDLAERILAVGSRMGAQQAERVVFIADGNPALWTICGELYPEAVQIQDFWHVVEYLSAASKAVGGSEREARGLLNQWAGELKEGRIDGIVEALKKGRRRRRCPVRREVLRMAIDYLEKGRERMDYKKFREEGLPIGSGAIESACKHVVKQRYNISGARWSRKNSGNILALRTAIANGEWEQCWTHKPPEQVEVA